MAKSKQRVLLTCLLMLGMMLQSVLWFAPASLLPAITEDLGVTLAQSGLLVSVICLVGAVIGPFSGVIVGRLGIKKTFLISMALLCAGSVAVPFVVAYGGQLFLRFLIGIGFGLSLPLAGTAISAWYDEDERPYLNTFYAVLPYISSAVNFILSAKIFLALEENWRVTLAIPGVILIVVMVVWGLCRDVAQNIEGTAEQEQAPSFRLVKEVLRDRQVRLICLADACDMWGFQFLSSYLTTYLYEGGGRSLDAASSLTSIFPVTGIAAGLVCGVLVARSGRRKPFTWPMHLLILLGTVLIVTTGGVMQIVGIALAGFGNASWAPALYTMPMEFEGMTTRKVSIVFSLMLSLGYLAAFISPILGGYLAEIIGLDHTMLLFSLFALAAAALTFCMKETGKPGKTA